MNTRLAIVTLVMLASLSTLSLQLSTLRAQAAQIPAGRSPSPAAHAAIAFDEIGAAAGKQYSGDGLAVSAGPAGASLNCVFQRLDGRVTSRGLWLTSTKADATGEPFRVVARSLGRFATTGSSRAVHDTALPDIGKVHVEGQKARFLRPGLTEEYSVSMDGLQQDFVMEQKPPGQGQVRLELEVDGARAEPMAGGARLVLDDGGRQMVYNRLSATDARGRPLAAELEVLSPNRLAVVLDDAGAEYPVRIDPTFSDANWISFGGLPGTSGNVYALAVDNAGNLYIGGSFNVAGNVSATNIAEWNGSSWSSLGAGLNAEALALLASGTNLYAGGTFTTAGGIVANGIAEWNGHGWSALGSGMNGTVDALAVLGTNLCVGGNFTTATNAGGAAVNCNFIAQWNGSSWFPVGAGIGGGDGSAGVYALAVSGTNLYAGGDFTTADGISATNIAQWSGGSWSALRSGVNNYVNALAVSGGTLYAGGGFTAAGGIAAARIAQWNGTNWSSLGSGMNNSVAALTVSGGTLYAGGFFTASGDGSQPLYYIAQWNGSNWSPLGSGMVNHVLALAASGNTVYAGGLSIVAGGIPADYVAQWNGSGWLPLGLGLNNQVWALAVSGSTLYAGGVFTAAGGTNAFFIAQWNGGSWSPLGAGLNGFVNALAMSGTNLYVGGDFTTATNTGGAAMNVNYIAQWNGGRWSALGAGLNDFVNALAVSGTNLYVGGDFTTATNTGGTAVNVKRIAQWNGSSWSPLGSGLNSFVYALAASGTNLYVGGDFTASGDGTQTFNCVAQWNGNNWLPLGLGLNNQVSALAVSGTNLYAGGDFNASADNTQTFNYIAQWNGGSWSPLGSGMNSYVSALAVSGTNLYAGGNFTSATNSGGVAVNANCIAQWNGSSWTPLGSGLNKAVHALAASGGALYVGGAFTTAGTNVSAYLAAASLAPPQVTLSMPARLSSSQFQMTVNGVADQNYTIQMSTNLASTNWVPLWVTNSSRSSFLFNDPNATNQARFYRVWVGP